jgi:hypothetical protein
MTLNGVLLSAQVGLGRSSKVIYMKSVSALG